MHSTSSSVGGESTAMPNISPYHGSVFQLDISFDEKELLVTTKTSDGIDLRDQFIQSFVPNLFQNLPENSINKWSKEVIFDNNELLFNGKIFGVIVNFQSAYDNTNISEINNPEDIYHLSEDKHINIKKILFAGENGGEIFIPLIPIVNDENKEIPSGFKYPDYVHTVCQNYNITLPEIETSKLMVLDVYNFLIACFLDRDYLNIISIYDPVTRTFKKGTNTVTYTLDGSSRTYDWIRCKASGHRHRICPLPLITWVFYFHAIEYGFMPLHFRIFFNERIKFDISGVICTNNL